MDFAAVQSLIQQSVDLLATVSVWYREAAVKAHKIGLQGEKRRMRYLYREANNIVDTLQHSAIDLFGIEIQPRVGATDVSGLITIQKAMNGIIEKSWKAYDGVHQLANDFVMAKFKPLSDPLYCYADCLLSILSELERARKEYNLAEWEYHHISRYQVGWCNIHDEYEKLEEEQGYKDLKEA